MSPTVYRLSHCPYKSRAWGLAALMKYHALSIPKVTVSSAPKTITVHVEGGMVQDADGIPPGYEVRVEDYDHSDDTQPTWDAEKEWHITVYEGGGV